MTTLREAAQQALEALGLWATGRDMDAVALNDLIFRLEAALAQQAEPQPMHPELRKMWEDHFDKCFRAIPVPEQAEPVEPVAWLFTNLQSGDYDFCYQEDEHNHDREMWHKQPLYSAPPQRKPLTEEEILKAIGWERAEMYMKLTPNFPVAEAKKETLKNARAIERAHGIGDKE